MKIVDCFIFYNELPMLEYRLSLLYDIVDYFVICEASRTHVGKPKPFFYLENKAMFERFQDKIIHIPLTDENTEWVTEPNTQKLEQWKNENMHRNGIMRSISQLNPILQPDDLITICDLDEIPNPDLLNIIIHNKDLLDEKTNKEGGANLLMDFYYYNVTCQHSTDKWNLPKIVKYSTFLIKTPQEIRETGFSETFPLGGWHLSYFGDEYFIKNKIENFAHQEYNSTEYTDIQKIKERMENKVDIYNRTFTKWKHVPIEENTFLPPIVYLNSNEKWFPYQKPATHQPPHTLQTP